MTETQTHSVWAMPSLMFVCTLAGLLAAIFGDGPWDIACWVLVGGALAVIVAKLLRRS